MPIVLGPVNSQGYYHQRWRVFIQDVYTAVDQGIAFEQQQFNKKMIEFEQEFVDNDYASSTQPLKNGTSIIEELIKKYRNRICIP